MHHEYADLILSIFRKRLVYSRHFARKEKS